MTNENTGGSFNPSDIKGEAEVDENNPWGDDALERQKFAKPLTDLVNSAGDAPFCIAVDGEWGSGKTFLLKRWRAEFSKQGNKAIYFNAWEDDFYADPLTAIIGQLREEIESPALEEICDLCDSILKKTLIELLGKALKGSGFEEKDLRTAVGGTVNEYAQTRNTIEGLKQRLKKLAKDVRGEETKPPLVFIVDELDRCRPTFAIELLERVKHIVGVPGIVFVFGINQEELQKSIQSVYGDIDAADYLRRFFDIGMTLPQAEASNYCQYLINKYNINENVKDIPADRVASYMEYGSSDPLVVYETGSQDGDGNVVYEKARNRDYYRLRREYKTGDWSSVLTEMPEMVGCLGLSLRQTEHAVRMLWIALRGEQIARDKKIYKFEVVFLVFVLFRIKNRDLYTRFINGDCAIKEAMDSLLHFIPKEVVRTSFIKNIIIAFYSFYKEEQYNGIDGELQKVSVRDLVKPLSPEYHFVPEIIAEISDADQRRDFVGELITLIAELRTVKSVCGTIQQRFIADLLEWGDYLSEQE